MQKTYNTSLFFSTVVDRHVAPLAWIIAVRKQLTHEIFESEPSLLKYTCFSILTGYHIFWSKSCSRSYCDRLFTCGYLGIISVRSSQLLCRNQPCRNLFDLAFELQT